MLSRVYYVTYSTCQRKTRMWDIKRMIDRIMNRQKLCIYVPVTNKIILELVILETECLQSYF